jgi:hypothetical protein
MADFNRIRYRRHDADVCLYAFDLIELNGDDLRPDPLQVRKATLASVIARVGSGLRFNEHMEETDPARLQARARRHRIEASRLALYLWPHRALAQIEESKRACGEAGSRRGLGAMVKTFPAVTPKCGQE